MRADVRRPTSRFREAPRQNDDQVMRRRVVVTGLGCVTPLGSDVELAWNRLTEGRSGVRPISLFDASTFPVRIAAEVPDWSLDQLEGEPANAAELPRQTGFAIAAARRAWRHAGLGDRPPEPRRTGVSLGCGEIFPDLCRLGAWIAGAIRDGALSRAELVRLALKQGIVTDEFNCEPGDAVRYVAGLCDAQGPSANFTTACVSSTIALGEASEVIRRGDADIMIAGGAHSMIHALGVSGFHRLSTLSTRNDEPQRASRPFDRDREGFVVGEGAAIVVLEELEHARHRGAEIWGELAGFASTHDAYRISDPLPDGRQAARCIRLALDDARRTIDDVDYVNAHGSGTPANDTAETAAIKAALGKHAYQVPVSSTKSMTGHLTTAGGALEFLFCTLAVRRGVIPPTINYETPDPTCDLDYVPNAARQRTCRHVLNNSFGFGGQNAVLVVSRYDG
jgi:3-oxoacyl-[acyl-carrier-protein] synthase II